MWGGPDQLTPESDSFAEEMEAPVGSLETTAHSFSLLLELAADNDVEGFKRSACDESEVGQVGIWYGRDGLSRKMILEHRTPLMVAAKYGSVDFVKLILLLPNIDLNFSCGPDKTTALHCAASGGSINGFHVVKMLLLAGADPNVIDAEGHRPADVIVLPPNSPYSRVDFEELLGNGCSACQRDLQASIDSLSSNSLPLSLSSEESLPPSLLDTFKPFDAKVYPAEKEYSVDLLPLDINNSVYTTDEFRMFSFKVHPCSQAYIHDWTECPFVHPGENARRRDPRRFHYCCVPCSDYRKGACRRGDFCEYAHGIFECWLHPAQYRTRFCKDGTTCKRRVCFFAHSSEELRLLYAFALPSPQAAAMDCTAASNMLPGSPLAAVSEPCTPPPLSPSSFNTSHSARAWHQQSAPGRDKYFQASRLRTAISARDIPSEELDTLWDHELQQQQLLNEMSCIFEPRNCTNYTNRSACPSMNSPNSDMLSSAEVLSICSPPSYKLAVLTPPQQRRNKCGPTNKPVLSPENVNHLSLQASLGSSSPGIMSPRISKSKSSMECQLSSPAHCAEELDVSWDRSVLKDFSQEITTDPVSHTNSNPQIECSGVGLQAWLDGLQLDQMVAQ